MQLLDVFRSRRVLVIALLGFSSGLPLFLTGQTLVAWMTAEGVNLATIGTFSLVGLPYTFKWAWAPLLDRYRLPFLGRRRGWLLVLQLALAAAVFTMGTIDPRAEPAALALAALAVAVLSASQDIVVGAFNTDTLHAEERAAGSAMYVTGYRVGMLLSGGLALALADHLPWRTIYWSFAAAMGLGVLGTLLATEPPDGELERPRSLAEAVWRPFRSLLGQPGIVALLAFVALYKFGEHLTTQLVIPFLKRDAGYSFTEIAAYNQALGFAGILVGGVLGGGLVARHGVRRSLVAFGLLQAVTNLGWAVIAVTDRSLAVLGAVVVVDNVTTMMATGAFVAYLMSRCDHAVSATQYALLTSLSSLGARTLGVAAAALAESVGWATFWIWTALVGVPAVVLVRWLPFDER